MALKAIKGNVDLQSRGRITLRKRFHVVVVSDIKLNLSLLIRRRIDFGNNALRFSLLSIISVNLKRGIYSQLLCSATSTSFVILRRGISCPINLSISFTIFGLLRSGKGLQLLSSSSLITFEILRIGRSLKYQTDIKLAIQLNLQKSELLLNIFPKTQNQLYNANYGSE